MIPQRSRINRVAVVALLGDDAGHIEPRPPNTLMMILLPSNTLQGSRWPSASTTPTASSAQITHNAQNGRLRRTGRRLVTGRPASLDAHWP